MVCATLAPALPAMFSELFRKFDPEFKWSLLLLCLREARLKDGLAEAC
jgi:hypothetical protein